MFRKSFAAFGLLLLPAFSAVEADQLEKGDTELQFRFTYSQLDFDGPGGDVEFKEALGIVGYMLTDHHEVSAGVAYGSVGFSDSVDFGISHSQVWYSGGTSLGGVLGRHLSWAPISPRRHRGWSRSMLRYPRRSALA